RQSKFHGRGTPLRVQRVCQLDASLLDSELNSTLLDQAQQAVSLFKGNIKERYKDEISAGLEALVYGFALFGTNNSATYGARLQNLRYRNEYEHSRHRKLLSVQDNNQHAPLTKLQSGLFCLTHVGGRYAWRRFSHYIAQLGWADMPEHDWRRKCWQWMQQAERIGRLITLANLIVFLFNGRYRTPLERILGMRLIYANKQTSALLALNFLIGNLYGMHSRNFYCFLCP
ncbi:Pex12 amino terminal region-domain-containing protein, partial [Syncephalis fuscata]